jgi:preprotein translocase subunit SecG
MVTRDGEAGVPGRGVSGRSCPSSIDRNGRCSPDAGRRREAKVLWAVDRGDYLPYVAAFPRKTDMLFTFLLVVHAIIAALLVGVILMQKSEGGGLTTGGSPSGLMSARGAANFLTRATAILATLFIVMSIVLAVLAATHKTGTIDTSRIVVPAESAPAPGTAPVTQPATAPLAPADNSAVPLAK